MQTAFFIDKNKCVKYKPFNPALFTVNTPTNNNFRKHQRVKSPDEFKLVYKNKQWGNTRLLTFNILSDESLPDDVSQLGVTVSKKVSKLAVRRNQLKRVVREFYRHKHHELKHAKLIITLKPAARNVTNNEIRSELDDLWGKILKWQRWHNHQIKQQHKTKSVNTIEK